jgi:translation initiation factor IF-1
MPKKPIQSTNIKEEGDLATGVVTEALPNTLFRVILPDSKEILAYLSGKMRLHRIRVLVGDKVEMVMDPYGERARITRRL